jgi:hypothetical protein
MSKKTLKFFHSRTSLFESIHEEKEDNMRTPIVLNRIKIQRMKMQMLQLKINAKQLKLLVYAAVDLYSDF